MYVSFPLVRYFLREINRSSSALGVSDLLHGRRAVPRTDSHSGGEHRANVYGD